MISKIKYFSKYISILIAVLFIYNSVGYLFLYFPIKSIIKQSVAEAINENRIERKELSILVFNLIELKNNKYAFTWVKPEKEFRYNGKMYDVERKEVKEDSIYFTCYYDHKENILEDIFALQFNDNKKDKTNNLLQRIIFAGIFSEEIKGINPTFYQPLSTNIPLHKNESVLLTNVSDVPTPPPRHSV